MQQLGPAQTPPVPICASCGVVAMPSSSKCESCGEAIARIAAPFQGSIAWSAVRASFACRSCGFPSPLEGVVVADGVECAQCGSYQRFDKAVWSELLDGVHSVADLGGPNPEGRFPSAEIWIGDANEYATIGVAKTFAVANSGGLAIEVCPGFPVCKACKRAVDVRIEAAPDGRGIATTICGGCSATTRYAMPRELGEYAPKAVAVIAEEQRDGRVEARVHAGDAGVVSMTCPQCGAALKGSETSSTSTVECAYCHTLAFIPSRARPKGPGRMVKPIVFFTAFNGRSNARDKLEFGATVPAPTKEQAKSFLTRGLSPLPGIELAPVREGVDIKQWLLTISLTLFALAVGYVITIALN